MNVMSRKKRRIFYADGAVISPVEKTPRDGTTKSIISYASELFKETSISLISNIIATASTNRRLFKTLVLLACLSGFLYQLTTYLLVVLKYPTTVDIDIERPKYFNVPAYTFCNNNGIKRSAFCEKYPDRCYEPDGDFCDEYFPYCGKIKTQVPKKQFYFLEQTIGLDLEDVKQKLHEFLVENKNGFNATPTGPFLRTHDLTHEGMSACYSLQSLVTSQNDPYKSKKIDFYKRPVNTLKFKVDEDDVFIPGHQAGMLFSIHSPFLAVNPFEGGIFMKPGRKYKLHVIIEKEVLMKYPYDTNCLDYRELWENKNRTGPAAKEMCRQKCLLEQYVDCFNCAWAGVLYPHNERLCVTEDVVNGSPHCTADDFNKIQSCLKTCKDDCWKTKYRYEVQERYNIQFNKSGEIEEDTRKLVSVEIYIDNEEIIVLRHKPKYLGVEVFGSIGGFLGGWLGASLIGISDFIECIFQILRYSAKKLFR